MSPTTVHNATPGDSTLLRFARAALDSGLASQDLRWEAFDLDDPANRQFGDYELLELLGRGGMGVVYRARQHSLQREVAIKFIATGLAAEAAAVEQFLAEARAAARLHHPNIVPVFEVGSVGCLHFFSMPLLRGPSLEQAIGQQPLDIAGAVALLRKLAAALSYAHSFGLLHLDLKPANILLDERGEPLIGDFGLARQMDAGGGVDAQEVSGTPAYMAPEQIQIRQFRLTAATDIYALGALLYRLLGGQSPHGFGASQELMQNALAGRIRPLRDRNPAVPADLAAICQHCLQLHGKDRYPTAAALAADLARFADGNPVSVRQPGLGERFLRLLRRRPALTLGALAVLLALALGLAGTSWQWRQADAARLQAERHLAQSRQLAGLLAALQPTDALADGPERDRQAARIVDWLDREGGAPGQQRELLGLFAAALRDAGKRESVNALLWEVVNRLGQGHRRALSEQLAQNSDRDSLVAATMLLLRRPGADQPDPALRASVVRLLAEHGEDALSLVAAAHACHELAAQCPATDLAERLQRHAADSVPAWTFGLAAEQTLDLPALTAMAAQARLHDGFADIVAVLHATVDRQPIPDSIAQPLQGLMDSDDARVFARRDVVTALPVANYHPLIETCRPDRPGFNEALRSPCLQIARSLRGSPRNPIVSQMVAITLQRRLAAGTAEADAALAERRRLLWLREQLDALSGGGASLLQFDRETATLGEWEAYQRMAERAGISRQPPAHWQPKDPQALLLPEHRTQPVVN